MLTPRRALAALLLLAGCAGGGSEGGADAGGPSSDASQATMESDGGTVPIPMDPPDSGIPDEPCSYSQPIEYVDPAIDGEMPCGPDDGTCVSGRVFFDQTLYTISEGDIGEAYLFGNPNAAPLMIFRRTTPPAELGFKIPNIGPGATSACTNFQVGGRLDIGGNNQGRPGGQEDPVLAPSMRLIVKFLPGQQIDGLELVIR